MKTQGYEAWIQHGAGTAGPFAEETVPVRETTAPKNPSVTGYGARIPTRFMIRYRNRWRRVYCCIFSKAGTLYIGRGDSALIVNIHPTEEGDAA